MDFFTSLLTSEANIDDIKSMVIAEKEDAAQRVRNTTYEDAHGFLKVSMDIANGNIARYPVGTLIENDMDVFGLTRWLVIGVNEDMENSLTVLMHSMDCPDYSYTSRAYYSNYRRIGTMDQERVRYSTSEIRKFLNEVLINQFEDSDLCTIVPVDKKSVATLDERGHAVYETTNDKLWLLSPAEIGAKVRRPSTYKEGNVYSFFAEDAFHKRGEFGLHIRSGAMWLRSMNFNTAAYGDGEYVKAMAANGKIECYHCSYRNRVRPACVISVPRFNEGE